MNIKFYFVFFPMSMLNNIGEKFSSSRKTIAAVATGWILTFGFNYCITKNDQKLYEQQFREQLTSEIKDTIEKRTELEQSLQKKMITIIVQEWSDINNRTAYHTFHDSANHFFKQDKNYNLSNPTAWNLKTVNAPLYDHSSVKKPSNIAFERNRGDAIDDADDWKFYDTNSINIDSENIPYIDGYRILAIYNPHDGEENAITYFNPKIISGYDNILSSKSIQSVKSGTSEIIESTAKKVESISLVPVKQETREETPEETSEETIEYIEEHSSTNQ